MRKSISPVRMHEPAHNPSAPVEGSVAADLQARQASELQTAIEELQAERLLITTIHQLESTFIASDTSFDLFDAILSAFFVLTDCDFAFIDELRVSGSGTPESSGLAVADRSDEQAGQMLRARIADSGSGFASLHPSFANCTNSLVPVVWNQAGPVSALADGVAEATLQFESTAGFPLYSSNEAVGLIGLAKRKGTISKALVEHLGPMISACANLLAAWRNDQQRMNADAELKHQTERLLASNRELEAFTYSVSHDLRAPLRSVDSFSRIILEDYGHVLDAEGQRYLRIVRGEAQRMGHLIDDLLRFSRLSRETLQPAPVDFEQLAQAIFDRIPEQDRSHVKEFVIGPLPIGWGDYAMLRQLLENLLGNAVKFTRNTPQARIELSGHTTPEHAVYCVRDNGVGFDPRYAHKLFEVFQRLHGDDEFEGTGVGLAIVQRIVDRHHGKVTAEGAPNAGAAFHFCLPHKETY